MSISRYHLTNHECVDNLMSGEIHQVIAIHRSRRRLLSTEHPLSGQIDFYQGCATCLDSDCHSRVQLWRTANNASRRLPFSEA